MLPSTRIKDPRKKQNRQDTNGATLSDVGGRNEMLGFRCRTSFMRACGSSVKDCRVRMLKLGMAERRTLAVSQRLRLFSTKFVNWREHRVPQISQPRQTRDTRSLGRWPTGSRSRQGGLGFNFHGTGAGTSKVVCEPETRHDACSRSSRTGEVAKRRSDRPSRVPIETFPSLPRDPDARQPARHA